MRTREFILFVYIRSNDFYSAVNIIGQGYPFYDPLSVKSILHSGEPVKYYMPKRIQGKKQSWKRVGILVDPNELFSRLFVNNDDAFTKSKVRRIDSATRLCDYILLYIFVEAVETKFLKDFGDWKTELADKVSSFVDISEYNATIAVINDEGINTLAMRYFGRLVVLCLVLKTDLTLTQIRHLITEYNFNFSSRNYEPTSIIKYMRESFFIAGLPEKEMRSTSAKDKIQQSMSEFELERLNSWWANFVNHMLLSDRRFSSEEVFYLKQLVNKSH